jgi:hypothetical protein
MKNKEKHACKCKKASDKLSLEILDLIEKYGEELNTQHVAQRMISMAVNLLLHVEESELGAMEVALLCVTNGIHEYEDYRASAE